MIATLAFLVFVELVGAVSVFTGDEVILITGGIRGDATLSSVEILDIARPSAGCSSSIESLPSPRSSSIESLPSPRSSSIESLPSPRSGHSISVINDTVLLCDGVKGFPGHTPLRSCIHPDATGKWELHSTTTSPRRGHSSVVVGGVLHLIGGWASAASLESFTGGGGWRERALPYTIGPGSCVVRAGDNTALVTGGLYSLKKVASWNVKEDEWSVALPEMMGGKWWHGCQTISADGKEYVVVAGGMDDDRGNVVRSSHIFDVEERRWFAMGNLVEARAAGEMIKVRVGGRTRIFMLGGMNADNKEVNTIEELRVDLEDLAKSEWELLQTVKMNEKRGWFAAVAVEKSKFCFSSELQDIYPTIELV